MVDPPTRGEPIHPPAQAKPANRASGAATIEAMVRRDGRGLVTVGSLRSGAWDGSDGLLVSFRTVRRESYPVPENYGSELRYGPQGRGACLIVAKVSGRGLTFCVART